MTSYSQPIAKAQMLIRKPAHDVFEALVDPDITSKFWFTKGSGRLEEGKSVTWEWGQFDVQAAIWVTTIVHDQQISFEWPAGVETDNHRTVDIMLEAKSKDTTFVKVNEKGFDMDDEAAIQHIVGQTEGWALVLSALKAYLEHGTNLNLISDHHPDAIK
ncbi:SRPBCC family protein [Fodinibius salsisoli]|uniref:SRPBCC family protein n=1 Tax=Fodinibius salsisoli TaxID=2820877 RepID=A0ABT3PIA8_9BACT|nr:SRPBCC family protein [Fodinibius salsisoli]MCW9705661.1 SRPBCC family protein [Fodinibius salsisoli]